MYTQEREKEVKKMKVMQSEAEETLRKLEIETSSLRDEVNEVRGQSFALNSFQESKLHQDELDIDNVVNSAKTLQAIVNEKKRGMQMYDKCIDITVDNIMFFARLFSYVFLAPFVCYISIYILLY